MKWNKDRKIHFIGIGGTGMSGLARILLQLGYPVSGSDLADTVVTQRLRSEGAIVFKGHKAQNIDSAVDVVVVSTAVKKDNPELIAAKERDLTILHRADLLAELMKLKKGVAIAGSHGKTTTSALLGLVLKQAQLDPAIVVGGEIRDINGNATWGQGDYMAAEADESDASFLKLNPWMAVITNIEDDHLDHYHSVDAIVKAFYDFADNVSPEGSLILCNDDQRLREMATAIVNKKVWTYAIHEEGDYRVVNPSLTAAGSEGEIFFQGQYLGTMKISIPGLHNLSNALAVFVVCHQIGMPVERILQGIEAFRGVGRRFQRIGHIRGIEVVDDYAHHPTEVKATLAAAKQVEPKRVIAVFQPHRYSRTQAQYQEFGKAFGDADVVIINEVYPAGEKAIPGVSADLIIKALPKEMQEKVFYGANAEDMIQHLIRIAKPGDLVLTMGAGNIWSVGVEYLNRLTGEVSIR
ncbi:UDP-N-acetylmuramate--L-alanine ligase [Heliorestis convoluta]|uniref:UDP-N-acetylmuramate--L-alanine ligase n=1 Tax=Heliorestis convoluta TaxID=356322 RepID=A0A5Q2MY90_9FIRM|nr:UDP-N-acetylmuramate--L-alanine ligase [Heliorestis convoluta]QGG47854.1 UDP-N-acetylmuramate--alanine ligase [Heliorestis convoluta]